MDLLTACSMGLNLEYLRMITSFKFDVYVKGERFIIDCLKWTLHDLSKNELSEVTQIEIKEFIKKLDESYGENQTLKDEDAVNLNDRIIIWSDRIQNELKERKIIEVFTDGMLNPKQLLSGGKSFFPNDVWDSLSEISMSDLNDACLCLLTQSWTPAVMISLRASEDSIRKLYEIKTGMEVKRKGWNTIIKELKEVKGIDPYLLNYLDYVREIRNTAEHPDKIFDQMEAERLFHLVVNIIIEVNKELNPSN